ACYFAYGSPLVAASSASGRPLLRPEHSEFRTVRRDELAQHSGVLRLVPGPKAVDRDDIALLDHVLRIAVPNHAARRARLERPANDFPALVLDIEEEPRMRIRESHLHDRAGNRDRIVHIIERREGMMA